MGANIQNFLYKGKENGKKIPYKGNFSWESFLYGGNSMLLFHFAPIYQATVVFVKYQGKTNGLLMACGISVGIMAIFYLPGVASLV